MSDGEKEQAEDLGLRLGDSLFLSLVVTFASIWCFPWMISEDQVINAVL